MLLRKTDLHPGEDPAGYFGRSGPLVLEVGFGDGSFLVHLAGRHPEWNLLGVEVSLASVSRAFRRLRREAVGSARVCKGNARFLVRDVLPSGSIDRIYVNFPDPWPRKRHQANRLLQSPFFRLASDRLAPGGRILLTTDHEEYFAYSLAECETSGLYDEHQGPAPDGALDTKYAQKWQAESRPIHHVTWTVRRTAPEQPHSLNLETMQHALLAGDLQSVGGFTKQVRRFDSGTAIVTEAFRSLDGQGLLFTVVIEEPDLRQEVLVKAWPKSTGVFVGLQVFGDPMATRGIREAVQAVAAWLVEQGLEIRQEWI